MRPVGILVAARKRDRCPAVRTEAAADKARISMEGSEIQKPLRDFSRIAPRRLIAGRVPLVDQPRKRGSADERCVAHTRRTPSALPPLIHSIEIVGRVYRRRGFADVAPRDHTRFRIERLHLVSPRLVDTRGK